MVLRSEWPDESAVVSMRALLLLTSLALILASGVASAQSGSRPGSAATATAPAPQAPNARPKPDDAKSSGELRELIATYLAQCMNDWDSATHMTKQEWARTCQRVVEDRAKFRLQQEQEK
jgi:hypothetical protein